MRCHIHAFVVLLATVTATPSWGACPATNLYTFNWGGQVPATLSYAGTYTYTAANSLGQTQSFNVTFAVDGTATPNTTVGGISVPAIANLITDGTAANNLVIGAVFASRTPSITGATRVVATIMTFAVPIRDFSVQVNDIDFNTNQFRDWFYISGSSSAGTYVPSVVTPHATNNGAGAKTNQPASSLALGAATTPFVQAANEAVGIGASGNNATTGTLTASFVQPVTSATLRYGNFPLQSGETATGQQAFGLQQISFCAMPALSVTKIVAPFSDPVNATTNPKMIPGGDVSYTITVTNSNASNLDGADLPSITDVLASTLTFYNGDIDDGGPLTTNYEFIPGASGLSFAPANLTFSNNGGATYAYTPTAGYDPNINAVRMNPTGTFLANSSFSIRFRTQIK